MSYTEDPNKSDKRQNDNEFERNSYQENENKYSNDNTRKRKRIPYKKKYNNSSQEGDHRNDRYNRDDNRGGYNRDNNRNDRYNRDDNRGGYNRDDNRRGGYNRDDNRGGYNRDNNRRGGYNRDDNRGGYNRDDNRRGGYNRDDNRGGYNRDDNRRGGGYNRDNRNSYGNNQRGGYNSRNKSYRNNKPTYQRNFTPRRIEQPYKLPEEMRLNRFIANSGLCSRREADEKISAGIVTVNDVLITELGTRVKIHDKVTVGGNLIKPEPKVYILMNKPKDFLTTTEDPQERKTVMNLISNACDERIYPVGRLDRNSTGLLLLTNDGDIAIKLTHPSHNKKKIYHVFLNKPLTKIDMEQIANGVELEDGTIAVDAIEYTKDYNKQQIGVEIHSGKNRIIRRIFAHLGYDVIKLDRVYYAGLTKKGLPRGKWRYLRPDEVRRLQAGFYE